jgi:hypothetical protein
MSARSWIRKLFARTPRKPQARRVFQVDAGVQAVFANLTITNGNAVFGSGGEISNSGTLTVSGSTLSANHAGSYGGGIYNNNGMLTCVAAPSPPTTPASAAGSPTAVR